MIGCRVSVICTPHMTLSATRKKTITNTQNSKEFFWETWLRRSSPFWPILICSRVSTFCIYTMDRKSEEFQFSLELMTIGMELKKFSEFLLIFNFCIIIYELAKRDNNPKLI